MEFLLKKPKRRFQTKTEGLYLILTILMEKTVLFCWE